MIKIKRLEVKNFKSLLNTNIEEFGSVNLFYGYNNSGKSNIFKFLKLLFEEKHNLTRIGIGNDDLRESETLSNKVGFWNGNILGEPYLFYKDDREKPVEFEIILDIQNEEVLNVEILKQKKFIGAKSTLLKLIGRITSIDSETSHLQILTGFLNNKKFYENIDDIEDFFPKTSIDKKIGLAILSRLNNLVLLIDSDRYLIKETNKNSFETFDSKQFKSDLFNYFIKADKNEKFNNLIKFLAKFEFGRNTITKIGSNKNSFPFNENTELSFAEFGEELEIMLTNKTARLPLKNYGTGIQQFLFILSKIFFSKAAVVIVEELELNLSPVYQKELLRFLKTLIPELYSQLLISSHSPYFADKEAKMVDIVHDVRIDHVVWGGTSVDCHKDIADLVEIGIHYFE